MYGAMNLIGKDLVFLNEFRGSTDKRLTSLEVITKKKIDQYESDQKDSDINRELKTLIKQTKDGLSKDL